MFLLNSLVTFCYAGSFFTLTWLRASLKFCSLQKTSANLTGISTPELFTTVYWITVPFALVPTSLSAMTFAHGQTHCISCDL